MSFLQRIMQDVCVLCVFAYGSKRACATATVVIKLFQLFPRTCYCLLCMSRIRHLLCTSPRWTESLSAAIIPSKTSAVISAMFHQSVAIYSKAHCLSMLASTKIIAYECLCVCVCMYYYCYSSFTPNLMSFLWTNTSKRSWADRFAFLQYYFTLKSWVRRLAATHPSHNDLIKRASRDTHNVCYVQWLMLHVSVCL